MFEGSGRAGGALEKYWRSSGGAWEEDWRTAGALQEGWKRIREGLDDNASIDAR